MKMQQGFTLIELVVVIAIISILLGIGTLQFNKMIAKANVEAQLQRIYSDLMKVRSEALYYRRGKSVKFAANSYSIYLTNDLTVAPVNTVSVRYPLVFTGSVVNFNENGVVDGKKGSVCVSPGKNEANIDSLVISEVRIRMGKSNGTCNADNIKSR